MILFSQYRIIESPLMVEEVHIGHWLNGYRASRNRSRRIWKKLVYGTRKRRARIWPMTETRPKMDAFMTPGGMIICHPVIAEKLRREI